MELGLQRVGWDPTQARGLLRAEISPPAHWTEGKQDKGFLCCRPRHGATLHLIVPGASSSPRGSTPLPWRWEEQGGGRAAHCHGNRTSCGDAHPGVAFFFSFFFPFLSFCETSALIRERALRMYDPCKHRVPIDQAPLLLGVCAGSRNKGRRKEGRKLPSAAPSKQQWQRRWGLCGAVPSFLPTPATYSVFCLFVPSPSSLLLSLSCPCASRHQKCPHPCSALSPFMCQGYAMCHCHVSTCRTSPGDISKGPKRNLWGQHWSWRGASCSDGEEPGHSSNLPETGVNVSLCHQAAAVPFPSLFLHRTPAGPGGDGLSPARGQGVLWGRPKPASPASRALCEP